MPYPNNSSTLAKRCVAFTWHGIVIWVALAVFLPPFGTTLIILLSHLGWSSEIIDPLMMFGFAVLVVATLVIGMQIFATVLLLRLFRSPKRRHVRWKTSAVCALGCLINFSLGVIAFSSGLFLLVRDLPSRY